MKTYKIAKPGGAHEEVQGTVALLLVSQTQRHKFFIHKTCGELTLTDFRTGHRVAKLDPIMVERMARLSTYHRTTPRQAAQIAVTRLVAHFGVDEVLKRLAAEKVPTLNAA